MRVPREARLALAALAVGAVAGVVSRRPPADVRRLEYRLTLFEELIAVVRDPLQLGILVGASAGAIGVALAQAAEVARAIRPTDGLLLTVDDPDVVARATKQAQVAAQQALEHFKI